MGFFQIPICTPDKRHCVENIGIEDTGCLQRCSGLLVTSYTEEDITTFFSMLASYMVRKEASKHEDMATAKEFKG